MSRQKTRSGNLYDAVSQQFIREISYVTSNRDGSYQPSHDGDQGRLLLLERRDGLRTTIRVDFVRHARDGFTFGHFSVMRPLTA
jgi:hypothetical protein